MRLGLVLPGIMTHPTIWYTTKDSRTRIAIAWCYRTPGTSCTTDRVGGLGFRASFQLDSWAVRQRRQGQRRPDRDTHLFMGPMLLLGNCSKSLRVLKPDSPPVAAVGHRLGGIVLTPPIRRLWRVACTCQSYTLSSSLYDSCIPTEIPRLRWGSQYDTLHCIN